jgi:hypothetical protein
MLSARNRLLRLALTVCLAPSLLAGPGCTRAFYRNWADKDTGAILAEKGGDPAPPVPDLRARFADITNPDRPPMPPDDPDAKRLSPNPQKPGKAGVASVEGLGYLDLLSRWDEENRAELAERRAARARETEGRVTTPLGPADKPPYDETLQAAEAEVLRPYADRVAPDGSVVPGGVSKERTYLLKLEQAVELGVINSREYQTQRENVYLSALPVTLERFAFAPQAFAFGQYFRERFGQGTAGGPLNRASIAGDMGLSKLFSTGGLLLLSFANRTVINIGRAPTTSVSTLSLDVIQPLLRGAGFAVTLEPLTQAERNLLYAVRDFARFQQQFYVFIAGNQAPIVSGTVSSPGASIPAAAPIVSSIIALASPQQVAPGLGQRLTPIAPQGAGPQGYLGALGQKAVLVNQHRNIDALRRFLRLFQVYLEGSIVDSVQVGQVEQQLLASIDSILAAQADYRTSLDQLKVQLGLPMNVQIDLDDAALRPVFTVTRRFDDLSAEMDRLSKVADGYLKEGEEAQARERMKRLLLEEKTLAETSFPARLRKSWAAWEGLKAPILAARMANLTAERGALRLKRDSEKGLTPEEARRLVDLDYEYEVSHLEDALRLIEARPWEALKDPREKANRRNAAFRYASRHFLALLDFPFVELNEAVRKSWPPLPPVCLDGVDLLSAPDDEAEAAITRAALANRLDLMNQRAQVVDAWRKLAVAANLLMGTLDVQYHGDVSTPLGMARPLAFAGSRGRHQLAVNAELPLVRIAERNLYRAALINYQQKRRDLQLAEDNVLAAVRADLRTLRAAANSYHRVQKRNVELAYRQVSQALIAFSQPQAPSGPAAPPGSVGAPGGAGRGGDPAALTNQLLGAQNSLLRAENGLYNTWLGILTARMSLYRDLGVMPLDSRGVWIDDPAACCPPGPPAPGPAELPPPAEG